LDGVDEETFKRRTAGLTAYFPQDVPVRRRDRVYPVRMSAFQRKECAKTEDPRVGNFAYPDEVKEGDTDEMVKMGAFTDHLEKYSPKFGFMLKNIGALKGQQLVYGRFQESVRLFAETLKQNGFEELKLVKRNGAWKVGGTDMPKYVLYDGKGAEERTLLNHVFNQEWEEVPSIGVVDCRLYLTSASEGAVLRNVEHVHVMEPFSDGRAQVVARARAKTGVTAHFYLTTNEDYTTPLDFETKLKEKRKKEDTADEAAYKLAEVKKAENEKWFQFMKETSVAKERQKHTVTVGKKQVHFYSEKELVKDGSDFYAVFRTQSDPVKVAYRSGAEFYKLDFHKYAKKIDFFRDLIKF
jgi:hypothetical protein